MCERRVAYTSSIMSQGFLQGFILRFTYQVAGIHVFMQTGHAASKKGPPGQIFTKNAIFSKDLETPKRRLLDYLDYILSDYQRIFR